jgi:hypothetical protein
MHDVRFCFVVVLHRLLLLSLLLLDQQNLAVFLHYRHRRFAVEMRRVAKKNRAKWSVFQTLVQERARETDFRLSSTNITKRRAASGDNAHL